MSQLPFVQQPTAQLLLADPSPEMKLSGVYRFPRGEALAASMGPGSRSVRMVRTENLLLECSLKKMLTLYLWISLISEDQPLALIACYWERLPRNSRPMLLPHCPSWMFIIYLIDVISILGRPHQIELYVTSSIVISSLTKDSSAQNFNLNHQVVFFIFSLMLQLIFEILSIKILLNQIIMGACQTIRKRAGEDNQNISRAEEKGNKSEKNNSVVSKRKGIAGIAIGQNDEDTPQGDKRHRLLSRQDYKDNQSINQSDEFQKCYIEEKKEENLYNQSEDLKYNKALNHEEQRKKAELISGRYDSRTKSEIKVKGEFNLKKDECIQMLKNNNSEEEKRNEDNKIQNFNKNKRQKFTCSICVEFFNLGNKCPMILCRNQHSICKRCLQKLKSSNCPECREEFDPENVMKNRIILEFLLEEEYDKRVEVERENPQRQEQKIEQEKEKEEQQEQEQEEEVDPEKLKEDTVREAQEEDYQDVVKKIHLAIKTPLSSIKELNYGQKKFKKIINFTMFSKLEILLLNKNLYTAIDNQINLPNLVILNLSTDFLKKGENQIKELSNLNKLPSLKYLYLSNNRIKEMKNIEHLTSLVGLFLQKNEIQKINCLHTLKKLQVLNLNENKINKMQNLDKLQQLQELYLSYNKICVIENLSNTKKLKKLHLDNNQITRIQNLTKLTELQELHLFQNKITIFEGVFQNLKLHKLILVSNPINKRASSGALEAYQLLFGRKAI